MTGRTVHAPHKTIAVPDHNVPTTAGRNDPDQMPEDSRIQVAALDTNAKEFGIHYYPVSDVRQGIVHIVGPRTGLDAAGHDGRVRRQPHRDAWCFGALAHGIGTSEVETCAGYPDVIQRKGKKHEGGDHRAVCRPA